MGYTAAWRGGTGWDNSSTVEDASRYERLCMERTTTAMKITKVETIVINMPMQLDGPVPMQGGQARTSIDMLLVRIDTDAA